MKITIMGSKLELTESLKTYVEGKLKPLGTLVKRVDAEGAVDMKVEVGRTTRHHKHGEVFKAEVNLSLPNAMLRAEEFDETIRAAVDKVKAKLRGEILKYKAKNETRTRAAGQGRKK
jgi:putative sigma-54 modulation protein